MTCASARPAPLRCPTKPECLEAALSLLPRGRAWDNHDGGPWPDSVLYRFWNSIAEFMEFVHARWCALLPEFFCRTAAETRDLWNAEYGLPDPCDPFPDLCTKVGAIGGASCSYLQEIARSAGWEIECRETSVLACGDCAGCAETGCAMPGGVPQSGGFSIVVHLGDSPAFLGGGRREPYVGEIFAGDALACPPDIAALKCLMARVLHAHLDVSWIIVPAPVYLMSDAQTHLLSDQTPAFLISE